MVVLEVVAVVTVVVVVMVVGVVPVVTVVAVITAQAEIPHGLSRGSEVKKHMELPATAPGEWRLQRRDNRPKTYRH